MSTEPFCTKNCYVTTIVAYSVYQRPNLTNNLTQAHMLITSSASILLTNVLQRN